jgi:hypothetical protein
MTGILDVLNPADLPADVRETLTEIGLDLGDRLYDAEVAAKHGLHRDAVAAKRRRVAVAFLEQAVSHADELDPALRARVEQLAERFGVAQNDHVRRRT